ncbi:MULTISPECIES: aminotransferase class III-fold pyridoxal phosphate-dependent enzyme [unclassified Oceanispirochaeta]|uniref:aminotransferase class III-fold pyridoxal phosphate-dependent enzyme n=1 Tax=unclassified Oceanispirochaeta TaxID=2635722 RepID=UPI000E09895F|nr:MULTISPECIES: aminotransferase class III-fold pyridoxal phosphate-dependent enzyme [unclassified Oceanispirochaeta]MBF9018200.1 aminotransferase class III-fold pyridoxal phosphate-dependent enzyme [Oceanispirochaeta sp. M2]NPD74694.1 aminotransferase class III-fold pyridoxal phosphate-dependent enzyme [Oceanispirochaeta sp. M1]RDG29486.1 aminotransferase class III-fold pyridoxal phosphate-dependent enzyme [Oceanispirochaeta sp. M1]
MTELKETEALNSYEKSMELYKRALKVIPAGIPGHLGPVQSQFIPTSAYPLYAERAKNSYFWDLDGNKFIDYMCAYGPNVLGYNNDVVDQAAREQYDMGNCMALPGKKQVEFAELLVDTIEMADWAFFMKNGGDATGFARMIAHAATGRDMAIMVEGGYHGVAPWTQPLTHAGVTEGDVGNNLIVPWNDVAAVERLVKQYPGRIASFMATPYDHRVFTDNTLPEEGYWQKIRKICTDNGIVLIIDDVRCGFRLDLGGSAKYFGFKPDLTCYCKALANGYPISAVVGVDSLKDSAAKVFYTGSYWSSAAPMAAGVACINELKRLDGANLMMAMGKKLTEGLVKAASAVDLNLQISGIPSMFYMRLTNDNSLMMQQEFTSECARRGVFFTSHHNHFINCSLTDDDINDTVNVAADAFSIVAKNNPGKLNK